MKSVLYAPSYLEGSDAFGGDRIERTKKFILYYRALKERLGFDSIFMCDNGSDPAKVRQLNGVIYGCDEKFDDARMLDCSGDPFQNDLKILWFKERYTRGAGFDYPYCWRNLYAIHILLTKFGYEKVITTDTDGFVVSGRLAEFVKNCNSGWQAFWIKKYSFPTAEFHILNKDAFPLFSKFTAPHFMKYNGYCMETLLPFTHINRQFDFDRYGEDEIPQSWSMDYYAQCRLEYQPRFMGGMHGQES